jgi:hypothetical protein
MKVARLVAWGLTALLAGASGCPKKDPPEPIVPPDNPEPDPDPEPEPEPEPPDPDPDPDPDPNPEPTPIPIPMPQ